MKKDFIKAMEEVMRFIGGRIKENADGIKQNNESYKQKKDKESAFDLWNRTSDFNKQLLQENNSLLSIQNEMMKYLKEYKIKLLASNVSPDIIEYDADELFDLTLKGDVKIDEDHPGLLDKYFTDRLLAYYKNNEQYEICKNILDIHQMVSQDEITQ